MKKILTILMAMSLLISLTACSNDKEVDDVIRLEMSDEAKEYGENGLVGEDNEKFYLEKEYYDLIIDYRLENPVEQVIPECETENKLDYYVLDGSKIYTLTHDGYDKIIYYIHGGGWVFEISESHVQFCDTLATSLNSLVVMPLYPLAPEANAEETFDLIETAYKELIKEEKPIYIMGDSAGGEITLGLMYTIKEEGLKAPEKMVLISPCSDMSFTNEEIAEIEESDPVLAIYGASLGAKLWIGEDDLKNPKYSAVYADVKGYPNTMLIQGTNDILCPDNLILYEHLKEANVYVELVLGEGLWHVFPLYEIPESGIAVELIRDFCLN